ncbi:hypothetical protein QIS99_28060 [Streptomyces sp. B-S-A8]|uniref:Uncharacterized protein n=1 Tax=Streptomyces solicavernae TaxID=3043614 RepID=A0ABT6RZZ5_9ACTN|nr:hypothetical protein [Streptomyces sp. B-S-A8]MDI3390017.1 hypothetical protein [Streptomyces sp. B-S-A8]
MSTTRDEATAALREWSRPGRRADLLAAAWQAGETNVSALAEAARISRPTVYADLRSRGIDPDHRPKESSDMTTPVVIDGIDGESFENVQDVVERYADEHPEDPNAIKTAIGWSQPIFTAVGRYNGLRTRLAAEERARRERDRTLHLVETRWEALSTAANWLAAHHAYIVAVDEAHAAITAWAREAAPAVEWAGFDGDLDTEMLRVYRERILAAGHPPLAPLDLDVAAEADRLHNKLDQAHARRKALAAETLGLAAN